uniref:receptor protein-tyrosine kinase n=1 Tax=Eptatretus burgeri TaxID=7764 RepID=A0A8C4Q164_EPTBU
MNSEMVLVFFFAASVPAIMDLPNREVNAEGSIQINCSATGDPPPLLNSFYLVHPSGSRLKPDTLWLHEPVKKATFWLRGAKINDDGIWRCLVSTPTRTAEKHFRVDFKVPPRPQKPLGLLERYSSALRLDLSSESHYGDGPVVGALLCVRQDEGKRNVCLDVHQANMSSFLLDDLEPLTNYSLRIKLRRPGMGGEGDFGPEFVVQTDCPEPGIAPVHLDLTEKTRTSVLVSWELPRPEPKAQGVVVRVWRPDEGRVIELMVPDTKATSHLVSELEPDYTYTAEVLLYNCGSRGPPSLPAAVLLGSPSPGAPRHVLLQPINDTSLHLSWKPPSTYQGRIIRYLCKWQQVGNSKNKRQKFVSSDRTSLVLGGLKASRKYEARVKAQAVKWGEWNPPAFAWTYSDSLPAAPTDVHILNVTDTAASVAWRLSPDHWVSAVVLRYKVYGDATPREKVVVVDGPDGKVADARLVGLVPERPYLVEVVARNNVGDSSPNVIKELHTKPPLAVSTISMGIKGGEGTEAGGSRLLLVMLGSVAATCLTILLALLGFLCLRGSVLRRRRTFIYQPGSREDPVIQFSPGTLTLSRRPKPPSEPITYPLLDWQDIKFEDMIGEGNFGQVMKALVKKDGTKINVAIKMLKEFASEDDHRDFAGELEVLCKLGHHPNIINLIGACEHRGYLYIAIEYAAYGNLLDFLRKSRVLETDPAFAKEHGTASTLSSQQLLQFAMDVAKGMQYLSEKQFIHRDMAARNILVGENYAAKIADFGLSRGEEVYVKKTMGRLPVRWMAIESLNYSVYTTKSDVWSFGVLLWEIVSLGGTPYCGMTCAELYEKLPQGYRMEKPLNCDDEVYELMRQCWRDRPNDRPTFAQICVSLNRMLEARKDLKSAAHLHLTVSPISTTELYYTSVREHGAV